MRVQNQKQLAEKCRGDAADGKNNVSRPNVDLNSWPTKLAEAASSALKISLVVFLLILTGNFLLSSEQGFIESLKFATELVGMLFVAITLGDFLYSIVPAWYSKLFNSQNPKRVVFMTIGGVAVITICTYCSIGLITAPAVVDSQDSKCVESAGLCNNEESDDIEYALDSNTGDVKQNAHSFVGELSSQLDQTAESSMTITRYNELMEQYGIEGFDIEERARFIEKTFSSMFDDEKIEDWENYLLELDLIAEEKPAFVQVVISKGIANEVPFNVLVEVLDRGHELNGNHVSMLASRLNIEEFNVLENYGTNIAAPSLTGSNALISSLLNEQRDVMFEHFLANDRLVFSEDIDVLQGILETSSLLNFDASYARKAVEHGVLVSADTKKWIENELKTDDIDFYKEIKRTLNI